jgi:hypothetical protein
MKAGGLCGHLGFSRRRLADMTGQVEIRDEGGLCLI